MARLKLDLHPIFNDGVRLEAALEGVFREAEEKRISEIEIIPGKGTGALKKTVLRFLDRPEVKRRYHRIVKDSDNWGRLFVYFRWGEAPISKPTHEPAPEYTYDCYFCAARGTFWSDELTARVVECAACGCPNRVTPRRSGSVVVESGY